MRGNVKQAADVEPGDMVPVLMPDGNYVEPREVAEVDATSDPEYTFLLFTDGTSWAWRDDDPVLCVGGDPEPRGLERREQ